MILNLPWWILSNKKCVIGWLNIFLQKLTQICEQAKIPLYAKIY